MSFSCFCLFDIDSHVLPENTLIYFPTSKCRIKKSSKRHLKNIKKVWILRHFISSSSHSALNKKKKERNASLCTRCHFIFQFPETWKQLFFLKKTNLIRLFFLFFHSFLTNSFSMSINWNVLLWNIGIFNKMDQSRCETWTLLTNNLVLFSPFPIHQFHNRKKKSNKIIYKNIRKKMKL